LRIAVVSPFVDRRHGTERALAELLERLAHTYSCEIHLYSERVEELALDDSLASRRDGTGAILWSRVPSSPGPHIFRFAAWVVMNGWARWRERLFRGASFDLVISPGINCLDADVVIVHALFRRLQEMSRAEEKGDGEKAGLLRNLHRRAYYTLVGALERRVYGNRRVELVAVSRRTADLLTRYFRREDVRVVPNGVDVREFSVSRRLQRREAARTRRGFRKTDLVLLLIGNDWRAKGLPAILAAMAEVPDLPLRLLVAGNDAPEGFRELAKRLGVLERCRWESPRDDVIDFYAAADVYVSPSREDSFGLPVAEAMACGLAAISSSFAGVSELIHTGVDGFVLRNPEDVSALAKLIERLHRDADLRQLIGEAAARTAQEWTWERHAAGVWEVLKEAAAKKQSHGH
jgi:UDP-glucose:(heptosyl)LPS alpha-1,3-glucosyltransferase